MNWLIDLQVAVYIMCEVNREQLPVLFKCSPTASKNLPAVHKNPEVVRTVVTVDSVDAEKRTLMQRKQISWTLWFHLVAWVVEK